MKSLFRIYYILFPLVFLACSSDGDEPTPESDNGLDESVVQEILNAHNSYRSAVGIENLTWSDEIEASAQQWANELSNNCDFKHSNSEFGENIWIGTAEAFEASDAVNSWGGEIENYNYEDNSCAEGEVCGHYTQIVWANTTKVGCGTATCNGFDIWVCQYDPPGNFIGQKPY